MVDEYTTNIPRLEVMGLFAGYWKKTVLQDINLQVGQGEIIVLIGHNGAGKTTLLNVLHGILKCIHGKILLDGEDITNFTRQGKISLVPQGKGVFSDLTVAENLKLACFISGREGRHNLGDRISAVYSLFPRLCERTKQKAGLMSGGEQRMLSVGMALMQGPKLLLLDEPSLGLAPLLVQNLMDSFLQINKTYGTSILLVEQNVRKSLDISERVYIIKMGRIIKEDRSSIFLNQENYWDYF